jgi:hypothetical protein
MLFILQIVAIPLDRHYPMFQIAEGRYSDIEQSLNHSSGEQCARSAAVTGVRSKTKGDDFTLI